MIKIEKAIATEDAMRGIIYLRNDDTGKYEDEVGEVDLFNDEGGHFYAFLYLSEAQSAHLHLTDKAALDKLELHEKIRAFISEIKYLTDTPTMTINVSFLSDRPTLIYEN